MDTRRRKAGAPRRNGGGTAASPRATLIEAVNRHRAGDLADAARLYDRILKADPKHPDALHLRGLVAHQQGHSERALSLVRKAIAFAPGNAAYRNTLGNVLLALDDAAAAEASFRRAVQLDPGLAEAHNNLGNALLRLGRPRFVPNTHMVIE